MKRIFIYLCLFTVFVYGAGRLYFKVTGGFRVTHISSDFKPDPKWATHPLTRAEFKNVEQILSQPFHYLGKGCQSYVFESEDGKHVVKFFKYQRFRPQFYLYWFSFIPMVEKTLNEKLVKKERKLNDLYSSWKLAFDELQKETGLVYVHLNKTKLLDKKLTIYDKIGMKYELDMDQMEFLIQKKGEMLTTTLDKLPTQDAKQLLSHLLDMIISEYHRGLADNDHALMQNTGVVDGYPVHIDVGQFVRNNSMRIPQNYHQELFNKYYKFRLWLSKYHPELLSHVNQELRYEMGEKFSTLKHIPKEH